MLAMTGTAAAHPQPGGFGFGLTAGWFDESDLKVRALQAAAEMPKPASGKSDVSCQDGTAGPYRCKNVDLLSNLPLAEIGGGTIGNDIWGWTDPRTNREYALMGRTNGTAFVDITNPPAPAVRRQPAHGGRRPAQLLA